MIKIQNEHLERFAKEHYEALKDRLSFIDIKKTNNYKNNSNNKNFIQYIEDNLKSILIGNPNELREHIKNILKFNINFTLHKKVKNKRLNTFKQEENEFINKFKKIFHYDSEIDKPSFAKNIGIVSCPYCNREYIFKFIDDKRDKNKLRTLASLDHYSDKGKYPYLALSFFNLIPSCHTCNSKFKTTKDFFKILHLHPYEDDFNKKAKFTQFFENVNEENRGYDIFSKERISLKVKSKDECDIKTQNTIVTFRLNELYNEHKDIVLELIQKEAIYNESYLDELLTQYEGTLFKNKEDLQRLISGGYVSDEEIGKRPLSKLIKDISEELGLLK